MDATRPYPWHALERIARSATRAIADAHEALAFERGAIEHELGAITGQTVRIASTNLRSAPGVRLPRAASVLLQSPDADAHLLLELEGALAAQLAACVLQRPRGLVDPVSAVPDSIQAAVAAVALLIARRLGKPLVLRAVGAECSLPPSDRTLCLDATVLLGDESFACRATLITRARPTRGPSPFCFRDLARLGELPIALPLVAAVVQAPGALVRGLREADVLLAGGHWRIARSAAGLHGKPVLCAPAASRGLPVDLLDRGRIVLLEGTMSLDVEERDTSAATPVAEAVAEAPVVVRIELGQVSMSARQWASLKPGDIIATGARVAERAVLRIGGQEVARGELVDIEGELGVRIHELLGQHNGGSQ